MLLSEWQDEARRLFGSDSAEWRFKCPSCGHVAAVRDWQDAGAPESAVAFSCVGRWLPGTTAEIFERPGPCNYAGGGLFGLNPTVVIDPDGNEHRMFAFAEPWEVGITREHFDILWHSIGMDRKNYRRPLEWWLDNDNHRNYFCEEVDIWSRDLRMMLELVKAGLLKPGHHINRGQDRYYHVTPAGIELAKKHFPKKKAKARSKA